MSALFFYLAPHQVIEGFTRPQHIHESMTEDCPVDRLCHKIGAAGVIKSVQ